MNNTLTDAQTLHGIGFKYISSKIDQTNARIERDGTVMWVPRATGLAMRDIEQREKETTARLRAAEHAAKKLAEREEFLRKGLGELMQDCMDESLWRDKRSGNYNRITGLRYNTADPASVTVHFENRHGPQYGKWDAPLGEFLDRNYRARPKDIPPAAQSINEIANTLGTETEEQKRRRRNLEAKLNLLSKNAAHCARLVKELTNG